MQQKKCCKGAVVNSLLLFCNIMRGCKRPRLDIMWSALCKAIGFMPSTVQLGQRGGLPNLETVCFLPSSLLWSCLLSLDGVLQWFLPPCSSPLLNCISHVAQQRFNSAAGGSGRQTLLLLLFASLFPNTNGKSTFALMSWSIRSSTVAAFSLWCC